MGFLKKFAVVLLLLTALLFVLDRCSRPAAAEYTTVTLTGQVKMIAGPVPPGPTNFRVYVLESLEGDLSHPLEEIEDFQSDSPDFTHTFEYPLHMGSGLAVHAWVDSDGDGIFCTPSARLDPSGLAYTEETPVDSALLDITLTENCRAANWFYPPAP
jgi:hypothetical protein